ncbi:MAG TPA: ABC transporter permease [Vicinamibacterales bacterium]|nr:ABC transporter permease [Vicinamibacterales bacterium]
MGHLGQDLRYGVRSLLRQPTFSALAILTLALGIGANAAMFSIVDAVLLRPLPYAHADRIVSLANFWTTRGVTGSVSAPDFHDWQRSSASYDAMAYYAFTSDDGVGVGANGVVDYARVTLVTPAFFDVFERRPIAGRALSAADAAPTAVVSAEFARRRFTSAAGALGRAIDVERRSVPIVGVMPPGFSYPAGTDIWLSASTFPETTSRSAHNYRVVARLKPGVAIGAARAELAAIAARLEAAYPTSNANKSATMIPLQEQLVGNSRATLLLLFGVVALVLLVACANVANLLLARATGRTTELAVRAALGAGRARLVAQLLTESLLLALVSAGAGLLFARGAVDAFVAFAPTGLPRLDEVRVDARVLAFALAAAAIATVVFGLVPALQASRLDLNGSLRQGGRGTVGAAGGRWQRVLVVGELALAVGLVAGAALLVRSFVALSRADLGYGTEQRLVVQTTTPYTDAADARRATGTYAELLRRIEAVPGVESVAGVRGLPGTATHSNGGYWIDGGPGPDATGVRAPQAVFTVVTPRYFETMAIPLRAGRDFGAGDVDAAPRVAIVNEALARQAFPNGALGRRIMCGLDSLDFMTIVGVVGNVREYDPSTAPLPEIYMPYRQHPTYGTSMRLVVRTGVEPLALADAIRTTIAAVDPTMPTRMSTMTSTLGDSVATPRFRTWVVGGFAALALVLAMAGVYGVMAYLVSRRTAEIGVRMAMGATAADVLRLVVGEALRLAAAGAAAGLVLAFGLAQSLRGMLFGVAPADPLVLLGVPVALAATAVLAAAVPAWRAATIDALAALRSD